MMSIAIVGLIIVVIGLLAFTIFKPMPAESATSTGTCLPIDKGGTGCDWNQVGNSLGTDVLDNRLSTVEGRVYITESGTTPSGIRYKKYSDNTWQGYALITTDITLTYTLTLEGNTRLWRSLPNIPMPTAPNGCMNTAITAAFHTWGTVPVGVSGAWTMWASAVGGSTIYVSAIYSKADTADFTITGSGLTTILTGICS